MYIELLIFPEALAAKQIDHQSVRATMSKACEAFPVDTRVFARGEDGKTLNATYHTEDGKDIGMPPLVVFGGGKGFFRVTGLGAEGVKIVQENAQLLCAAIGTHFNCAYRFRWNEGHCSLKQLHGYVQTYYIPQMAIHLRNKDIFRVCGSNRKVVLDDIAPSIIEHVKSGLVSQARFMDESYVATGDQHLATMHGELGTDDMLNIEVHEGSPNFQPIRKGQKEHALFANQISVTMAVELSGPWFCGHLRSRGNGLILRKTL